MVTKLSYTANSITLGTGTSKVILGADSGNLIVKDSDANTSIVEPGLGIQGGSSVSTYANPGALPFSPISPAGSLAYTTSTGALYMSNGSGWYKITLVNTAPSISLSSTTASPTASNLTLDFTYAVTEPEGTPTTISIANSGIATVGNVAITHTTSNNHVRLVFDGTTNYTGDASVTLTVTDGVNTGTGTITITTAYYTGINTAETVTLLKATGTGNNGTFDDGSTSNHTVNKNGTVEQLSFSPYRDNGYSMYFDGTTNTYASVSSVGTLFGSGDFTVECWVYFPDTPNDDPVWEMRSTQGNTDGLVLLAYSNGFFCYHQTSTHRIDGRGKNYLKNKWTHVAVQRSSGTLTMYVDGISIGTATWNYNLSTNSSAFIISGGRYTSGSSNISTFTKAFISDFRIVKGATVYSADFDPPTSRLTNVTNTELLIGSNGFRDNKPITTASQKSLYFGTNSNNYLLNYGDESALEFGTNSWTIEAWIYSTGNMSNAGIFSRGANGSFWHSLHMTSASTIKYVLSNGAGKEWNFTSSGSQIPTNTWTHVALVRRFGTDIKLYVNGSAIKTDTSSASTTLGDSTADFKIGFERFQGSGGGFNGYISNFRFVNGTAVYTGDFTPPTSPLTNITNTVILHYGLTNEVSGGVGNPTNTSVTVNNLSPFNTVHTISPIGNTKMEAFSPYDRGEAYTTATGGGSAYHNNGDSDYLEIPASADHQIYGGDYTVEAWLYPTSFNSQNNVFLSKGTASAREYHFSISASDFQIYWSTDGGSSGSTYFSTSTTNNTYEWIHVAITKSGNTVTVYKNGVNIGTGTFTSIHSGNSPTVIGRLWNYTGISHQYRGYISNLRIVKGSVVYSGDFIPPTSPVGATTNTKLLLNFIDSKIYDKSQSVNRLTIEGSTSASLDQNHFSENTVYFDGSSDYIDLPWNISGYEDHTHEAWVYPTGGDSTYGGFWSSITTNGATGINVSRDLAGGPSNSSPAMATFSGGVPANQWSHVMLQRQSGVHTLYRNGVFQGSSTISANFTSTVIRLGSRYNNNTTWSFGGYMHDFRVSKSLSRYPYTVSKVTLTQTNSGLIKPDGTTPTATASNTKLLACHHSTKTTEGSATGHAIASAGSTASGTIVPKYGMNSVHFPNGDSDYFQIGASVEHQIYTGDYTVEAWLYPTAFNTNYNYFISKGGNTTREWAFSISASNIRVYWSTNGSSSGDQTITKTVTNNLNQWMHVAFAKSGNDITIYKNGSFIGSGTFNSIYNGNGVTTIARLWQYTGISHQYSGYISNLRIVKGQALYAKNFTPTTEALIS